MEHVPESVRDAVDSIVKISLCRVYATYEDTKWIQSISKCVTRTPLRYIIPITDKTIMISYLDGEKADELSTMDDSTLRDWVIDNTKLAFPAFSTFIPVPTEIKRGYWKVGVHMWAPMKHAMPPKRLQCDEDSFSISGEAFSLHHQGWLEGALELHTEK